VLKAGEHKTVNSSPVTVASRKLESNLPIGKFREFALDLSQVEQVKVNGNTLELEQSKDYAFTVNPTVPATTPVLV
jgi:hypothetical protein